MVPHWIGASSAEPCPICGKPDRCWRARDRRVVYCGRTTADRTVPGWRFDQVAKDKSGRSYTRWRTVGDTAEGAADVEALDFVYRTQLCCLGLPRKQWAMLQRRGLPRSELALRQYRHLDNQRNTAVRAVLASVSENELGKVPEFHRDSGGTWSLHGPDGIVIPVRDLQGRIQAIKILADEAAKYGSRYVYVNPGAAGGPNPGSPVHVPVHGDCADLTIVRLMEGVLRADIATVRTGILTLGLPSLTTIDRALTILKNIGAKTVLIAFDAEFAKDATVRDALLSAVHTLRVFFNIAPEYWRPSSGRGIDDALAAGDQPKRIGASKLDEFLAWVAGLEISEQPKADRGDSNVTGPKRSTPLASHAMARPSSPKRCADQSRPLASADQRYPPTHGPKDRLRSTLPVQIDLDGDALWVRLRRGIPFFQRGAGLGWTRCSQETYGAVRKALAVAPPSEPDLPDWRRG